MRATVCSSAEPIFGNIVPTIKLPEAFKNLSCPYLLHRAPASRQRLGQCIEISTDKANPSPILINYAPHGLPCRSRHSQTRPPRIGRPPSRRRHDHHGARSHARLLRPARLAYQSATASVALFSTRWITHFCDLSSSCLPAPAPFSRYASEPNLNCRDSSLHAVSGSSFSNSRCSGVSPCSSTSTTTSPSSMFFGH